MTLASTAGFLALYALLFQTVAYLALPRRFRTTWLPVVTGVGGSALTLLLLQVFHPNILGFAAPNATAVTMWGSGAIAMSGAIGGVMIVRPATRRFLADPRVARLSRTALAGQILFRIPVLTALIEEAVFRGALFAALNAVYSPGVALVVSASLFGIWHVAPGFSQARANGFIGPQGAVHVLTTVMAMTAAGLFLGWLRMETGSIWAPFTVHASVNMTLAVLARVASTPRRSAVDDGVPLLTPTT
jgi:membrane protease YdiL (CAAX protease family)